MTGHRHRRVGADPSRAGRVRAAGRRRRWVHAEFLDQKLVTARFFATQVLPQAAGLLPAVTAGPGRPLRRHVLTDLSFKTGPIGPVPKAERAHASVSS